MHKTYLLDTTDFSGYSKDELLGVIKELQRENALLIEHYQKQSLSSSGVENLSFRQLYAEDLLDSIPDMLTVVTDNGDTVAVVSSEESNHSGIPRDKICGVPVRDFLPNHVYEHVMESIEEAKIYGKSSNLSHLMYVEGQPHYYENRTVRIANDLNLCICRDITEEMLAKAQLESLSYAVNLVNENIFSVNPQGKFLFANKQFLIDHQQKEVVGKSVIGILFSCRTQEEWEELIENIRTSPVEVNYICEHINLDGSTTSYEVVGRSVQNINNDEEFWFFARNINLRLQQESSIKELNTLMNAILSNIPIYLFVKDATDFRYLYWNKTLEQVMGITSQQAVGKRDSEIFSNPINFESFNTNDLNLIQSRKKEESIKEIIDANNEKHILKAIKIPVERDGKAPLIIGVALDITDLKQVEEKLITAKQEAESSNRLKSAFLANMSHEIRTPLNAVVGFAKLMMLDDYADSREEYAEIIDRNSDLLLQLINDILDLSKIEAGMLDFVMKEVNLSDLCSNMLEVHRMRISEDVSLIYEAPHEALVIESDHNRLAQVFTNLLSNAIKFTSSGEIRFGYSYNGSTVEGFVRDTGMGISPEKLPTIFDRFVKLNSFVTGTGLGLSITKTILERLGGTITVTSEEGKGTEFRFSLPY